MTRLYQASSAHRERPGRLELESSGAPVACQTAFPARRRHLGAKRAPGRLLTTLSVVASKVSQSIRGQETRTRAVALEGEGTIMTQIRVSERLCRY